MIPVPPLPQFPTREEIEAYFASLRDEMPLPLDVTAAFRSLYDDLVRFGPPAFPELPELPEIVPSSVGRLFVVHLPAESLPPPPLPKTMTDLAFDWVRSHRIVSALAGILVTGAVGYTAYNYKSLYTRLVSLRKRTTKRRKKLSASSGTDREIVIILGADSVLYGASVVRDFQRNGFIVIASVASGEAADALERDTEGYVRALVLDAEEPGSIPHFMRSLSSTLSLRFPTNVTGDPYASTTSSQSPSLARVASVISFLSLVSTDLYPLNMFDSPVLFTETYTYQFMARALSPLFVIQSTLPHLRPRLALGSPSSSFRNCAARGGASVILCVPAVARVGVIGSSSASMANAAVIRGFDILRREAAMAGSDEVHGVADIRFITVDVGEVDDFPLNQAGEESRWERRRKPSHVGSLSKELIWIVDALRRPWSLAWIWNQILGSRRNIGAGSTTYTLASQLPNFILDFVLLLPHRLQQLNNSLQAVRHDAPPPRMGKSVAKPPASPMSPSRATHTQQHSVDHLPTEAEMAAISTTASAAASTGPASAISSKASSIASSEAGDPPTSSSEPSKANTIAESWVSVHEED